MEQGEQERTNHFFGIDARARVDGLALHVTTPKGRDLPMISKKSSAKTRGPLSIAFPELEQ
jgi:hypothetical protein